MKYRCFINVQEGKIIREPTNWNSTIRMFSNDKLWEATKREHPDGHNGWYHVEIEDES